MQKKVTMGKQLIFVALFLFCASFVVGQHPCSAPPTWTGTYQMFTNMANRVPATEGQAFYNSAAGLRFDGNLGKEKFSFFNLPNAFFLVNTTVPNAQTCRRLNCGASCFKPFTIGNTAQWKYNSTVVVGLAKVEKWSVFDPSGTETVVIDQPLQNTNFKQCLPIMTNSVRGTQEKNLVFAFGLWYSISVKDVPTSELQPPTFCPTVAMDEEAIMSEPTHASLYHHMRSLNMLYKM